MILLIVPLAIPVIIQTVPQVASAGGNSQVGTLSETLPALFGTIRARTTAAGVWLVEMVSLITDYCSPGTEARRFIDPACTVLLAALHLTEGRKGAAFAFAPILIGSAFIGQQHGKMVESLS